MDITTKAIKTPATGHLLRVDVYRDGSLVGSVQKYGTRWAVRVGREGTLLHTGATSRPMAVRDLLGRA